MAEEKTLFTLRLMAWERAKGEIKSMLQTYFNDRERFNKLDKAIEEFIKNIEDHGTHE